MKKIALTLILVLFLMAAAAQTALATNLAGKFGAGVWVGKWSDSLGLRYFFTNNFAGDVYFRWEGVNQTGEANSHETGYSLAPVYVNEIFDKTLLEAGAVLDGWEGANGDGSYSGWGVYPFVGAEYLLGDHFGIDFKLFLAEYSRQTQGSRGRDLDGDHGRQPGRAALFLT